MKVPDDFHVYTTKGRIEQEKKQAMKDLLLSIPVEEYDVYDQSKMTEPWMIMGYEVYGYNQKCQELKQWVDERIKSLEEE